MGLTCGECKREIPDDPEFRRLEDDIVVLYCKYCKLTYRIPIVLADAEVEHDIQDAFSDIYFG